MSAGNTVTNGQEFSLWKFNKLVLSWHCKLFTTKILYIYHTDPDFAWLEFYWRWNLKPFVSHLSQFLNCSIVD